MVDATTDGDDTQKNTWSNYGTNHNIYIYIFIYLFNS